MASKVWILQVCDFVEKHVPFHTERFAAADCECMERGCTFSECAGVTAGCWKISQALMGWGWGVGGIISRAPLLRSGPGQRHLIPSRKELLLSIHTKAERFKALK